MDNKNERAKKVSLNTIAERVGCSTVTVYKALNNQQGVGEDLRKQIVEVSTQLNYRPPQKNAYELNQKKHYVYIVDKAFIINEGERFYSSIYFYLNQLAEKYNSSLKLIIHDKTAQTLDNVHNLVLGGGLNGIFIGGQIDKAVLTGLKTINIHTVCIDFYSSDFLYNYVYIDNFYSGYLITKHLINKGHTNIAYVGDIKMSNAIADRYFGYLRALNKFDIKFNPQNYILEDLMLSNNYEFSKDAPTAFICRCDKTAELLYGILAKHEIRVPQDASVVSFDNTEICTLVNPPLTSLGLEKEQYAIAAYSLMLNPTAERHATYSKLDLKLYERGSVLNLK